MIANPQTSREQGMTRNNFYVCLVLVVNPLDLFPFCSGRAKVKCGGVVDGY
jgi:hypothetical protein